MSGSDLHHPAAACTFGILGNIISLMVYLAQLPTFYIIYTKKSTEGFLSLPYVLSLFSSTLWIYYAILKSTDVSLLVINVLGFFFQTIYIITFLIFADRSTRKSTWLVLGSVNLIAFGLILVLTLLVTKGESRVYVVGWICAVISVTTFITPLQKNLWILTKSEEFMFFSLSLLSALRAVVWFLHGLLAEDLFVAIPNVLGFLFVIGLMIFYLCYIKANEKTSTDVILGSPTAVAPIEISVVDEMKTYGLS